MKLVRSIGLFVLIGLCSSNGAWANSIYEKCRDGTINAQRILASWNEAGVFRDFKQREGSGEIFASTAKWERVDERVQISIGIAAYCFIADHMGRGVVTILGSKQERLGSVVNGNWSPN